MIPARALALPFALAGASVAPAQQQPAEPVPASDPPAFAKEAEAAMGSTWRQSPLFFLPGTATAGDERLAAGSVVVHLPLRWAWAIRLPRTVAIRDGVRTVELASGSLLPKMRVLPEQAGRPIRYGFCPRSLPLEARGNWYEPLVEVKETPPYEPIYCLEDGDADGDLDRAFVLGRALEPVELGPIDPLEVAELVDAALDGEGDHARIVLERISRGKVELKLHLQQGGVAMDAGGPMSFLGGPTRAEARVEPGSSARVDMLGIRFTIAEVDQDAGTARIAWAPVADPRAEVRVAD